VWATESLKDTTAYVSPTTYEYAGKKVIVGITARSVFGVDAGDGSFLWTVNYYEVQRPTFHKWAPVINCITPIYQDGKIYVTSGYDHVGMMLELNEEGTQADIIWTDTLLDCHHGGVVMVDGYIYGSNWLDNSNGNWCCIEWETGKSVYEKEWYGKGSVIAADGLLYCLDEKRGNLALVNPTPEDFEVISSFRIPKGGGPHWAHATISEGKLLIRHGQVLMVYDISNPIIN
jgi:outer membrane protein assembly factor BamB